jgi:translation initiation factor 1
MPSSDDHRLVYSSDTGPVRYCPRCGQREHPGRCATEDRPAAHGFPRDGVVRVAIERAGRRGKAVTAIHGLPGDEAALAQLAKALKQLAGSGGTVRDGVIELQGDHRQRVAAHLTAAGYKVKLAGG